MGIALNDETRRLLDGRHFAVLATINPDGGPQTSAKRSSLLTSMPTTGVTSTANRGMTAS